MSGPSQDLHAFLTDYPREHPEDVLCVEEPVDGEDIAAVAFELAGRGRDPLLRFGRVTGLDRELVTNVFASRTRLARLFGVAPGDLHAAYQERARHAVPPHVLRDGPVLQRVSSGDDVDVAGLPLIRHFASDLGPYVTSGVVVAEDPDGGAGNMSYHRATPHTRRSLALSLHSRGDLWRLLNRSAEQGRPLPVAVVLGGHPLFLLAASARVPMSVDERDIAGGLFGAPLEVVRTPRHGIRVPATADLVLEGTIDAGEHGAEGPFGEFSGYSSHRSTNNVLRIDSVLARRDAVALDVVAGNSAEHLNLARVPREAEMAEKLRDRFPEVTALHYPTSGTHFHAYVAVRGARPGQARQVMLALLGWDPYLKTVVAVDADVDVTRDASVLWALACHFQPSDDLFTVDGLPGSPLDPSSSASGTTSRMGLDATRSPDFDSAPITFSPASLDHARELLTQ